MSTRTVALSALTSMLGLLLVGCGESGGSSPGDPSTSSASSEAASESSANETPGSDGEYVPASAVGPAQNVPKPEKPELADEESYEGAQAFLDYLADARAYAWQTGDTSLIREITSESCETCQSEYSDIDTVYESGGWASPGREKIEIIDTDMPVDSQGFPAPRANVEYEGMTVWGSEGDVAEEFDPISGEDDPIHFHLEHVDGSWLLILPTPVAV